MPRQLRDKGGIASVTPREKYGLGSKIKDRFRKLIPNELADVAVKAAPFVAPFNPGIAGLMRGIGRFDQRGSISDALKQGAATFAFGKAAGKLGGAESGEGFFGGQKYSMEGFKQGPVGSLFKSSEAAGTAKTAGDAEKGVGIIKTATDATIGKIPGLRALPPFVQQQLFVGGITSGASALASYFQGDFREQEEGETMEEYLAARRDVVGKQMRVYMDNYYANDPEYSALDDAGRNAFVARYNVRDGGRIGYQTGGISSANTLAQNIALNKANQAAISKVFQAAASKAFPEGNFQKIRASSPTQKDYNIKATKDLVENLPGGIARDVLAPAAAGVMSLPYDAIQGVTRIKESDIDRAMQTATMSGPKDIIAEAEGLAYARENPLSSAMERTIGAAGPLAERISGENLIPGFIKVEGGYQGPDGQIYGAETYASIAAGMYPNIYDPNKVTLATGGMPVGIMRSNKAGVMERDYRDEGGFVPVGIKEKADDVPAMLSKNEFVFTADAVRGAGNGSIEKGAQKMYDTMKNLERRVV